MLVQALSPADPGAGSGGFPVGVAQGLSGVLQMLGSHLQRPWP